MHDDVSRSVVIANFNYFDGEGDTYTAVMNQLSALGMALQGVFPRRNSRPHTFQTPQLPGSVETHLQCHVVP
jgi:hypothetical protein